MCKPSQNPNGFSLVELLIVVAVMLVVLGLLIPNMAQTLATIRLHGTMTNIAGLYQNARTLAIRQNKIKEMRYLTVNGNDCSTHTDEQCVLMADDANNQGFAGKPPQLWLPSRLMQVNPPSSSPSAMDATTFCAGTYTPPATLDDDPTHQTAFNQMGLPCWYDSGTGTCTNKAFAYYFTYTASLGQTKWAALAVSPAGRVKACYWDGSKWAN